MNDDNDLSSTVVAKSDQLNADDLIEPINITITRVDKVSAKDQPVLIHTEGRQPYKPSLTMRRMLIACWGKYKDKWVGETITVYCDPEVMWAGKAQGGIRVSHATGIDEPVSKWLTVTRGRKAVFTILPLVLDAPRELTDNDKEWIALIKENPEAISQIENEEHRAFIQKHIAGGA